MKRFFRNISWVQILAAALAAVTVFFFSAKIGLAGSIIGVAVASIISTLSSQIYQNVLKESSKKIKKVRSDSSGEDTDGDSGSAVPRRASSADKTQRIEPAAAPLAIAPASGGRSASGAKISDHTSVMPAVVTGAVAAGSGVAGSGVADSETEFGSGETTLIGAGGGAGAGTAGSGVDSVPPLPSSASVSAQPQAVTAAVDTSVLGASRDAQPKAIPVKGEVGAARGGSARGAAPLSSGSALSAHSARGAKNVQEAQDAQALQIAQKKTRRKVVLVSAISGLVAVGITVGLILLFTNGQGTDTIVRDAVNQSQTPEEQAPGDRPDTEMPQDSTGDSSNGDADSSTDTDGDSTSGDTGSGSSSDSGSGSDLSGSGSDGSDSSGSSSGDSGSSGSGSGSGSSGSSGSGSDSGSSDSTGTDTSGSTGSGAASSGTGTGSSSSSGASASSSSASGAASATKGTN